MSPKGWAGLLFCFFGALAVGVHARAQEGADRAKAPAPPSGLPGASTVTVVPSQAMLPQVRTALTRMREILTRALKLVEEARNERDVVKLHCVNEKLTAIKGLLRISEQADVALEEALADRNQEVASHELEKVAVAHRKCEQLLGEAEACIGELAVYAGETSVEMLVEGVPEGDPTSSTGGLEILTRPPPASPYQ